MNGANLFAMDQLNQLQVAGLKSSLEQLQSELQQQLDRAKEATATVNLDQTLLGRVSRMDAMQQQSVALSTLNLTRKKLQRVQSALRDIDSGDYGFCKRCDEEIGFSRLKVQPEANLCIHCQDTVNNQ